MVQRSRRRRRWGGNGVDQEVIIWLKAALKKSGISQAELSRQLGVRRDVITNVIKGTRQLKGGELLKIAKILNVAPPAQAGLGQQNTLTASSLTASIRYVPVVGEVAAGVFKEMYVEDFEVFEIPIPIDPKWPTEAVTALVVRGDSINRKAADGDYVVTLEYGYAPRTFEHGDWVVAERARGDIREVTVKRVELLDGIFFLVPDSYDPAFKAIRLGETDGEQVRVLGFVLQFVRMGTRL